MTGPATTERASGPGPGLRKTARGHHPRRSLSLRLVAIGWAMIAAGPFVFLLLTSFKERLEVLVSAVWALPQNPTWDNYRLVIENDFLVFLRNSLTVVTVSVVLVIVVSAPAAYVFSRFDFPVRTPLFTVIIAGLIVPIHVALIPIYLLTIELRLFDSIWGLVGPYVAFATPATVFILTGFMRAIPTELEEAAMMDGAGPARRFSAIVLPLSRSGIVTVAIFNAVTLWNEFVFAFVLTTSRANRTLPLAIWDFQGQYGNDTPTIMAVLSLTALPLITVYALFQERIHKGIMAGAVKA